MTDDGTSFKFLPITDDDEQSLHIAFASMSGFLTPRVEHTEEGDYAGIDDRLSGGPCGVAVREGLGWTLLYLICDGVPIENTEQHLATAQDLAAFFTSGEAAAEVEAAMEALVTTPPNRQSQSFAPLPRTVVGRLLFQVVCRQ